MSSLLALLIAAAPAWTEPNSRELAVFPFTARLGAYQARQFGLAGELNFPLAPSYAITFRGQYDYAPLARDESDLCAQTACRLELRNVSPHGVMVTGAALLGVELRPELAEAAFHGVGSVHIDVVLGAALGATSTRRQLSPENDAGAARFGDSGWRFTGQVGGGLRFRIARWLSVRTEVRTLLMSSGSDTVNGCSFDDLEALDAADRAGRPIMGASVGPTCRPNDFNSRDLAIARNLTRIADGHLLAIVQVHLGLGLTF